MQGDRDNDGEGIDMIGIRYWLESSGIDRCPTCFAKAVPVPYGGHPLSRVWNRIDKNEILLCCPNGCLEGSRPNMKIWRGEIILTGDGTEIWQETEDEIE
jgi:hypothetical protein